MTVQCELCPKNCVIAPGQSGECRIRVNVDGQLLAVTCGYPCSVHVDPVEKKPLYHFLPGSSILSIATVGCNLHCKNCQNWEISQEDPENVRARELPPALLPELARQQDCESVAYTYTDPCAYYEYALDGSIAVRDAGLRNVLVTAAYCNQEPWKRLCAYTDGANIDIKSISDQFYRDICSGRLAPVLNACVAAKSMAVMVEITNLVIPTLNDSDDDLRELCRWIVENLGKDTPLHFSRFFPHYQMRNLPPTPPETLDRARAIALAEGLYYVYIGNLSRPEAEHTYCHSCKAVLVKRRGYRVLENTVRAGACPQCGTEVYGVWQ
ncbi:MAG: AmmeMemoRadiSam system radical SAM enzyme [Nitrospiraceae bacterium]|nr:AmmeMemoRadiSam system radical SAM enzyme [Nitrospiraceae bacterium]